MAVFIIAEAGVNHNGCIESAKKLIDVAVESGADAIKFQTFKTENLVTETAEQSAYQSKNMGKSISQFEMLKVLELNEEDHQVLKQYCLDSSIEFMSTPFDEESIDLLERIGVIRYKIPSGEMLSVPYLRKIAALNKPTILSTGMGSLNEVKFASDILLKAGLEKNNLTILHANSAYPTPYEDVNLNAMLSINKQTGFPVGLSDHSLGVEVPIAAVALGAKIIEKHFTLDKTLPGPDHKASLEPNELKSMVSGIRNIELALGNANKVATESELSNLLPSRKSIVASQEIKVGDVFTVNNLTIKRPAGGLSPIHWDDVLGKKAKKDFTADQKITLEE